jgi:hypothetical protein
MFRRLGSAFFSARSADAADATLSADLEKAASNSVQQVRSLAQQSFLQVHLSLIISLLSMVATA